jgi:hypothetical protein
MSKFDVVEWMTARGKTSYARDIRIQESIIRCIKRDAYWPNAEKDIADAEAKIEETRREAQDRYDDWASDPLP